MPIGSKGSPVFIAGIGLGPLPMGDFYIPFNQPVRYRITGVTKDKDGVALGNCTVEVYEVAPGTAGAEPHGQLRGSTVSDASGNYSLDVTTGADGLRFQAKAYRTKAVVNSNTTISLEGNSYMSADILTMVGGTAAPFAQLQVSTVGELGEVLTFSIQTAGDYTIKPPNPVSVTGGSGVGATFNLAYTDSPDVVGATVNTLQGSEV